MKEAAVQCPLGNGECPPECPNSEAAAEVQAQSDTPIDPRLSRIAVLFGDAQPGVKVTDVARLMGRCLKEASRVARL